jgi:excisionase family DNA binding protein
MQQGDMLTTKEAAELVRVSHFTISAWLSQKKLKRYKAGGRTLIARRDLDRLVSVDAQDIIASGTVPAR